MYSIYKFIFKNIIMLILEKDKYKVWDTLSVFNKDDIIIKNIKEKVVKKNVGWFWKNAYYADFMRTYISWITASWKIKRYECKMI